METGKRISEITMSYKSSEWWTEHIGRLATITTLGGWNSKGLIFRVAAGVLFIGDEFGGWDCPLNGIQNVKFHSLEEGIIWKLTNE